MAKYLLILIVVAVGVGGAYFLLNFEVQTEHQNGRAVGWKIVSRRVGGAARGPEATEAQPVAPRPTLRIATFHLGRFDEAKLANHQATDVLLHLLPQFDVVAVQGIRGRNQGALIRFVEQLSAVSGRSYDYATCPTQRRDALEHYVAFIFDSARVEVDRRSVRFIEDRQNRFRIKPLIGSFRVRGPDSTEAFTFTLINVETDREQTAAELGALAEAYRAVRNLVREDGSVEDDVILLGDLEADDQHLGRLGQMLGVMPLLTISGGSPATTTRGTQLLDNILLDRRATCEFAGRVEVVDMLREFGLSMPGALEISEHLPVWAEFSIYESGQAGR